VIKTEEKGSDVNLATFLLLDGFRREYDAAVVISNDSDLATPIHVVRRELQLPVGVINPHPKPSYELKRVAKYCLQIEARHLASSQFPPHMLDAKGRRLHRPKGW
jgi:hypothetical protein